MMKESNISCRAYVIRNGIEIGELLVTSCRVKYNSKSKVKRACQLTCSTDTIMQHVNTKAFDRVYPSNDVYPSGVLFPVGREYISSPLELDKIKDRIKIYLVENGIKKPLGVYMIISSPITFDRNSSVYNFELYDETMILEQNEIEDRLFIASGTSYLTAINQLLVSKSFKYIISDDNQDILLSDREWEIGTNMLDIINELLKEINFNDIHVNENGYINLTKKEAKHIPDFIYEQGDYSVLIPTITSTLDIYKIPNVFIGVVSNPDIPLMIVKVVNDRFDSVISTINRGYEITKVYQPNSIASQTELDAYIKNEFNKSLRQTETLKIKTALQAGHEFESVVQIATDFNKGLYKETEWDLDVSYQGEMNHTLEREVFI